MIVSLSSLPSMTTDCRGPGSGRSQFQASRVSSGRWWHRLRFPKLFLSHPPDSIGRAPASDKEARFETMSWPLRASAEHMTFVRFQSPVFLIVSPSTQVTIHVHGERLIPLSAWRSNARK
jgi:hypothetical protein